jgi:hypothetical protein
MGGVTGNRVLGALATLFFCVMPENTLNPKDKVSAAAAPRVHDEPSLLDILDHVLNAGVVLHGSIVISLAGVDLVYLGLNAVLTSVETAMQRLQVPEPR